MSSLLFDELCSDYYFYEDEINNNIYPLDNSLYDYDYDYDNLLNYYEDYNYDYYKDDYYDY
tara:strand:+ start:277 stop:459 length:183 start_codon:yes stop_codon:yes gene_type:complete